MAQQETPTRSRWFTPTWPKLAIAVVVAAAVVVAIVLATQSSRSAKLDEATAELDQAIADVQDLQGRVDSADDPSIHDVWDALERAEPLAGTDDYGDLDRVEAATAELNDLTGRAHVLLVGQVNERLEESAEEARAVLDLAGGHVNEAGQVQVTELEDLLGQVDETGPADSYEQAEALRDLAAQLDVETSDAARAILHFDGEQLDEEIEAAEPHYMFNPDLQDALRVARGEADKSFPVEGMGAADVTERREVISDLRQERQRVEAENG